MSLLNHGTKFLEWYNRMLIDLLLASLHSCVFFPDKKLQHEGKILNRTNFEKADS